MDEVASLKDDLSELNKVEIGGFVYGYYIAIKDPSVIDISNPVSDYRYKYAIVDCKPGDIFYISGYGGDSPRVYCFVDSSNTKLTYSNANENLSSRRVVAPTNAAKVIIQDRATDSSQDGKGLPSYKVMDMSGAVRFDIAQDKTEEEKARGRANLGVNLGDVVMTIPQTLSDAQKLQVRNNIGISETSGLSGEAKNALLALLRKVAYVVENGEEYYRALREALSAWLFNLVDDFTSTGANNVDTEIVLEEGKEYTILLCIIPSNDTVTSPSNYTMLYSNRRNENTSAYVGMHVIHTGNSIGVNGSGIDAAVTLTKSKIAYIATTITSERMMTSLVEIEKSGNMYSGTKQYEASKIYNGFSLLLGYQGTPNNQGFHGVFKDFKVVDYLLSDREIKSYVATGKTDYKILIMEIGNIDTSGVNDDTIDVRIRTKSYISVNDTLTMYGCPFASTWEAYGGRGAGDGYIIAGWFVRCYDSNKQFIGSTYPTVPDVRVYDNELLPTGTKYIKVMIQRGGAVEASNHYTEGFSSAAIYPLVIDGNAYFIEEEE